MNCEWRQKVALYADDELDRPMMDEVATHLRGCPECSSTLVNHLQMKKLVRVSGQRFHAPPELRNRIREGLHRTDRRSPLWKWSLVGIALVLIAVVGLFLLPSRAANPIVGELVDQHVTTLASVNPVDVLSSDRHTVKPWFQGKLPFTFNLPELVNSPFSLVGGKTVYIQQNPGAELLYEIRKHRISVFIFQTGQRGQRTFRTPRDYSFTIQNWVEGGLSFYLITDAGPEDARLLVTMFQAAANGP